ncbi:MAG: hypothetical protein ACOYVK_19145 [Bacillota bacterium]
METNQLLTFLLAAPVIGYGAFVLVRSIKKQTQGDCVGCSHSGGKSCCCSSPDEEK